MTSFFHTVAQIRMQIVGELLTVTGQLTPRTKSVIVACLVMSCYCDRQADEIKLVSVASTISLGKIAALTYP